MILRENVGMCPGGLIFIDPRVPAAKWMDDHTFLEERVQQVIKFRAANPNIYPLSDGKFLDPDYVRNEITVYNCTRLGNNSQWCLDEKAIKTQPVAPKAEKICSCGGELKPKMCPTCGMPKIIGYTCKVCGKEYGR